MSHWALWETADSLTCLRTSVYVIPESGCADLDVCKLWKSNRTCAGRVIAFSGRKQGFIIMCVWDCWSCVELARTQRPEGLLWQYLSPRRYISSGLLHKRPDVSIILDKSSLNVWHHQIRHSAQMSQGERKWSVMFTSRSQRSVITHLLSLSSKEGPPLVYIRAQCSNWQNKTTSSACFCSSCSKQVSQSYYMIFPARGSWMNIQIQYKHLLTKLMWCE